MGEMPHRTVSLVRRLRWSAALAGVVLLAALVLSAAPVEAAAPTVPTDLAVLNSTGKLALSWTAPANPDPAITGYEIQYREKGVTAWTDWTRTSGATDTSETITGLADYTIYEVQVRTRNGAMDTDVSPWAAFDDTMPAPVVDLSSAFASDATLAGLWSDGSTLWVAEQLQSPNRSVSRAFSMAGARRTADDLDLTSLNASNTQAAGVCWDGTTTWVGDIQTSTVHAYERSGNSWSHVEAKDFSASDWVAGLYCNSAEMWANSGTFSADIALYRPPGGARDPDRGFTLSPALSASYRGLWSGGAALWISHFDVNEGATTLHAFSPHDGSRLDHLDLASSTLAAAGVTAAPYFWSDGTHVWIVDSSRKRLVKLEMPQPASGPPLPVSAALSADSRSVIITFSEALDTSVTPAAERFMVSVGSQAAAAPSSVAHTAGQNTQITLTLASLVREGTGVAVAYIDLTDADDTAGVVQDAGGSDALPFTNLRPPVRPITETVQLVGNVDQESTDTTLLTNLVPKVAQAFTTGSRAGGYLLKDVGIHFVPGRSNLTAAVSIYSETSSGDPGSLFYTLAGPSSLNRQGVSVFRAPAGAVLEPSTVYFVVAEYASFGIPWSIEPGADEDSLRATGWGIGNDHLVQNAGETTWRLQGGVAQIRINGTGSDGPIKPGVPTNLMLTPGDRTLAARWSAPLDAAAQAPATTYDVEYKRAESDWTSASRSDEAALSETLGSLRSGHRYDVRVRARSAHYAGDWSATLRTTTTGTQNTVSSIGTLSLSDVTLSETVAPGTTAYTGSAAYGTVQTTVAATGSDQYATVSITPADADPNEAGHQVDLSVGTNTITVRVIAENNVGTDHTVTVTRAKAVVNITHQNIQGGASKVICCVGGSAAMRPRPNRSRSG